MTWLSFAIVLSLIIFVWYMIGPKLTQSRARLENAYNPFFSTKFWVLYDRFFPWVESVLIAIIIVTFWLVNPDVHFWILLVLIILFYGTLKNYVAGLSFRSSPEPKIGETFIFKDFSGALQRKGYLGVTASNRNHQIFFSYDNLAEGGFKWGKSAGNNRHYSLKVIGTEEHPVKEKMLLDMLTVSPYVDWKSRTKVLPDPYDKSAWHVHTVLNNNESAGYLVNYLKEQGFEVNLQ